VSRFELLLQVGTFCLAVGALVSGHYFDKKSKKPFNNYALEKIFEISISLCLGIFGMNLRSYLEEHVVLSSQVLNFNIFPI